jgi:release factor glutamine methyltransferase
VSRSIRLLMAEARGALVDAGLLSGDAALDAEVLARHLLGWDRAQLLTRQHLPPPDDFEAAYRAAISRRAAREPVALITGHREFWGLDFEVTRDVLVPRPETELLVERALVAARTLPHPRVIDVGTGSGCIAVALAHELPSAFLAAVDLSASALGVAGRNIAAHALGSRVTLIRADLLEAIRGPVDLIVSNPPYVAAADAPSLPRDVRDYEPHAALFAAEEGIAVLRRLCETAAGRLAPGGHLIVEFGAGQAPVLRSTAERCGWQVGFAVDLAGHPRVATMTRPS